MKIIFNMHQLNKQKLIKQWKINWRNNIQNILITIEEIKLKISLDEEKIKAQQK